MSRMPRKWNGWVILILALLAIGLFYSILVNPFSFIVPIVVLGGIFLLYKYPPSFLRGTGSNRERPQVKQSRVTAAKTKTTRPRSKTVPFRVIDGGKDDDDLPKYH
ncbi:hypothetical protein [Paenibacillus sp. sgz302251]|uniref:hypothetical protein n=1 Tax=Paenibacillus sp. sgz302251 TaxID=3414493 RepID=UPI003C7AD200